MHCTVLKKYNITDDDITIIKNNNYENIINVIIYNQDNVCGVIEYLLSIGIDVETLSQMLSDRLDIINDDIANLKFI